MTSNPLPFLKALEHLFHVEMDHQTSGCLFGSAATDDWVMARSDLDLLVLIPEDKIQLFGKKIEAWQSMATYPLLDGFVLYLSGNVLMAKPFEEFEKAARPAAESVLLIDVWNIKNRSKHLFGLDLTAILPEISQEELKKWALQRMKDYWIPILSEGVSHRDVPPETKIPLTPLVWTASGVARMLMLARGNVCSSKREALRWLADEYSEIREIISLLIEEYEKPDAMAKTFTARQTFKLGAFYLRLLRELI